MGSAISIISHFALADYSLPRSDVYASPKSPIMDCVHFDLASINLRMWRRLATSILIIQSHSSDESRHDSNSKTGQAEDRPVAISIREPRQVVGH